MRPSGGLIPLNALEHRRAAVVVTLTGSGAARQRLMDMGLTPGAHIAVEGTVPLGDPIIVWVRGSRLALRHREAAGVLVSSCPQQYRWGYRRSHRPKR